MATSKAARILGINDTSLQEISLKEDAGYKNLNDFYSEPWHSESFLEVRAS